MPSLLEPIKDVTFPTRPSWGPSREGVHLGHGKAFSSEEASYKTGSGGKSGTDHSSTLFRINGCPPTHPLNPIY
ncbi:hypothetical protein LINPERHAP2_LOCUS27827 [Linum perenne]